MSDFFGPLASQRAVSQHDVAPCNRGGWLQTSSDCILVTRADMRTMKNKGCCEGCRVAVFPNPNTRRHAQS